MALLGRQIFYDPSLSSSGKTACASCHSPDHAYGPPTDRPVMLGGPALTLPGARAVPSLTYLQRQPEFSIGPDDPSNENVNLAQQAEIGGAGVCEFGQAAPGQDPLAFGSGCPARALGTVQVRDEEVL